MTSCQLLDVVASHDDLPANGVYRGHVGTSVEFLAPDVFEVEFSDREGRAYALLALRANQLRRLRYEPAALPEGWLSRPGSATAP
jgi:hypothetical protein